jgi:hypothetical protein
MRRFLQPLRLLRPRSCKFSGLAAGTLLLFAGAVHADVLLDKTSLIGSASVAAPSEYSFTAATAQALTLTLTDLQTPAAFASLQVAVTLGDTLVGSVSVSSATHKATFAIPAAAGNYALHVIGTPDSTQGIGSFGVCVAPAGNASSCIAAYSFSGNIQAPAMASSSATSTVNTNFTATAAGTYTVTLTDHIFPIALQSISAGVFQGSTPISVGIPAGTPTPITLAAGTQYQLLIAATAAAGLQAGLYGIRITDPSGAAVFDRTLPVGLMMASNILQNPAAQGLSLNLTDYGYPAPLMNVGIAVTQGAQALAVLNAPGTATNFMAAAGTVEVWHFASAGASPGVYSVNITAAQSGAASLYSTIQVANPTGTAATSYAFVQTIASAGTYHLIVDDFQFPSSLQNVSATVAQNGTVLLSTLTGDFTAAQGTVVVLVDASAPPSGSGIFGVTIETGGTAPQILLDQAQPVGGVFDTQSINLGISGAFDVTLNDLAFPAKFSSLAVVVSQGSQVLGKIYGGGAFSFSATPGNYVLTFVATPAPTQNYGLYSVRMASSPPTVKLSAASSSVTAGQAVQLTWSSQNATSCTASGSSAWTGPEATSGSTSIVVDTTAMLTLTCTGAGGSAAQSVTVTAAPLPTKSGGGGGLDRWLLLLLGACLLARIVGAARPRHVVDLS